MCSNKDEDRQCGPEGVELRLSGEEETVWLPGAESCGTWGGVGQCEAGLDPRLATSQREEGAERGKVGDGDGAADPDGDDGRRK